MSGHLFVLALIMSLVSAIVGELLAVGKIPAVGEIIGGIITTPVVVVGHTLLYYDLRLRKEGYSVEMLANEVGIRPE